MNLSELRKLTYVFTRDFKRERFDPLLVDAFLNEAQQEFNADTGIYRMRTQLAITNGVGTLNVSDVQGDILRVEDANNNNQFLARTSEEAMDVLKGATWRNDSTGAMQFWMRGKPNEGNQNGYDTILVYPAITGTINVHYVKLPPTMANDSDPAVIPVRYHHALAWHAAYNLLSPVEAAVAATANGPLPQFAQQALDRYQQFLVRGKQEADSALRWH